MAREVADRYAAGPQRRLATARMLQAGVVVALVGVLVSGGLAAYVFAGDLQRAMRIGEALEAGMVGINRGLVSDPAAPFGGTKQSGLGREGARIGMEEFTEVRYLSIDWP